MTLKPNQSARIRENKSLEIVFYMGLPLFNEISKILFFFFLVEKSVKKFYSNFSKAAVNNYKRVNITRDVFQPNFGYIKILG